MARMIPDNAGPDTPDSERRIFTMLRESPDTRDWTVFHSQGLSSTYSGHYGEVDFVALIPGRGVLCIEVKGGGVRCSDGVWTTTNRHGDTTILKRSPFTQAQQGMFKLMSAVSDRFGKNSVEAACPFGWIVIFTDVDAPPPSPEFRRPELIDREDLRQPLAPRLFDAPSLVQAGDRNGPPSAALMLSLHRFLRPDFDRVATLSTTLWDAERRLVALTEEQYDVLDHIQDNDQALVHGGAGTGKTMLALEMARRLSAAGRSVVLTCFNRELGLWLEAQAADLGPGRVVAGHLHRVLRPRIAAAGLPEPDHQSGDTWYAAAALAVAASEERFDTILVDEAQDFPAGPLLDILEHWTAEGAASPRICLFADYNRQALYGNPEVHGETVRKRLAPARFPLRVNCRNTLKIASETELLTGSFEIRPSERQPVGPSVERIHFSADGGTAALARALETLRSEGFQAEDIVILGPRRRENASLAGVVKCGGFRIIDRDARQGSTGVVYSTIQAFKGLESPAVILVDIDPSADSESDAMLYVGMTRARTRLTLIFPETARGEIDRRTRSNLAAALA